MVDMQDLYDGVKRHEEYIKLKKEFYKFCFFLLVFFVVVFGLFFSYLNRDFLISLFGILVSYFK